METIRNDYDERAHVSVWEVYNRRFAALRAAAPERVAYHMVRLAIRALECALACEEHGITTQQVEALADWFCSVSPDELIRITAGAPDQGQVKALIAWHLTRGVRMRSHADIKAALETARVHGISDAVEFIEELRKNFTNEETDDADREV